MAYKKYTDLTETQIKKIARLCVQEQGSVAGVKAEASLMANQLETSTYRQNKYGTGGAGLYNWIRNGGWFYRSSYYMDNGSAANKYIEAVRDVLVNGNRTLPQYIDEHDCFSDIKSISTGSIRNRSDYISGKTIVKNKMGSTWTFYEFPSSTSDPFGYTKEAYDYVKSHGGSGSSDQIEEVDPYTRVKITTTVPMIRRGDEGDAVAMWQVVIGATADGIFGPTTEAYTIKWQNENGLDGDGIVGAKSWAKALADVR